MREHRLRVLENRMLRRRGKREQASGENYIRRSLIMCTLHLSLVSNGYRGLFSWGKASGA
jgi:hypothetical protein